MPLDDSKERTALTSSSSYCASPSSVTGRDAQITDTCIDDSKNVVELRKGRKACNS